MNKVDHDLSQAMYLALTAENNEKEKQYFDLPGYIEKGQSLSLDSRLALTPETEESIRKIRNNSFYGAFGPDKILPHPPTNDLEVIKSNIPSNMTEDERMLFTCLQEVELQYMLKNKNRKGLLKKKANSLVSKNLKTLLHRIANLPDYKLDEFFKIFIEGFTIPKEDKLNMFIKILDQDI